MRNVKRAMEWLRIAKSNLACAKTGKIFQDILYEDLCFNAQQAVEKALKSLCITHEIVFPRTHDISYLIELPEKGDSHLPDEVQQSKLLTDYAVEMRMSRRLCAGRRRIIRNSYQLDRRKNKWGKMKVMRSPNRSTKII